MKIKSLVECKSLGIQLTEKQARAVDELMKTLPKGSYKRKGIVPDQGELVSGERADISLVSVESVDREGDVVLAKGMDLELFQINPVVTFAHKYDELPVGRAQWIRKVEGGLKAKTVYSDATDTARAVWAMTQEGILKGKSIGFLPTKVRSATQEEISRNPAWKNASCIVESAVLLEYACCAIPVNQDALVQAVAKGLADRATLKRLGLTLPAPKRLSQSQIAAIIAREFARAAQELSPEKIHEMTTLAYKV